MAQSDRHAWTFEELQDGLARTGLATDFSSVFRAASRLLTNGAIRKISVADGRAHFELGGDHHDHLQCTQCDTLVPVPCAIPRAAFAAVEARTGGTILEHHVIFTGVCRRCRVTRKPHRRRR